ncbi:MAG TPA: hypothetical protein VJ739_18900, partial [Gemmataceae bacterium]|nr:hypothetical protein [Gemmataceae bacterium]
MHGESEPARRPLAQRLLGGSSALWEGSALVALAATLLPLADLWLCFAPPRPDHHEVVGLTVLVPLLVYLVTFPLLRLQPPERLQRLLVAFLGGTALALLAYLLLSARFVHPLDDRWHRDVFGWAYTAEAQRHRARHPGISDLELVKDSGSRIEDVFEPTSLAAARGLLLACWFALAAGGSLALT